MARDHVNPLLTSQIQNNRDTAGNWSLYAEHRERVTQLILSAMSSHPSGRICVLGAGNCNDLALSEIGLRAAEIHLVDADRTALERGLAWHNTIQAPRVRGRARIVARSGVDLTGLSDFLLDRSGMSVAAAVQQGLASPASVASSLGQPFHVVVSAGVLTQLISLPVQALGQSYPGLTHVVLAVRTGHLRLMTRVLRPGGHGLLVTDVVSSTTLPELLSVADRMLPQLLNEAVARRNFFTGVNPKSLMSAFRTDPQLAAIVTDLSLSSPWRWQIGPERAYLVIAEMFRRAI